MVRLKKKKKIKAVILRFCDSFDWLDGTLDGTLEPADPCGAMQVGSPLPRLVRPGHVARRPFSERTKRAVDLWRLALKQTTQQSMVRLCGPRRFTPL